METLLKDFRYGLRMLWKSPSLTIVAVISLSLGIAANTAIFSVINAVLLKPLPVAEPGSVVALYTSDYSGPLYGSSSYPDYIAFRDQSEVLSGLVAYTPRPLSFNSGDHSERVFGEIVTGNYFDVLGIKPEQGRTFLPEEDQTPGTHPVVVVSHDFWQKRFNSDPQLIGKTLNLNGQNFTVVGIAPESYKGLLRGLSSDLWVPIMMEPQLVHYPEALEERGNRSLFLLGRLKPGATLEQARARFNVLASQMHEAYPEQWTNVSRAARSVSVLPESEARIFPALRGAVLGITGMLMAVVGLVLLIACANVANLLLSRATARRKEIAVRLALGAGRGRLIRQLLTESVLLSLLSGALGFLLALWLTDLIAALKPPVAAPIALDMSLDARVLGFTLGISLLTGLLFGLAPALQASKPDLVTALKDEGGSLAASYRRSRLRGSFVVIQVALSLVLLICASLFLRSLGHANAIDPGFDPTNVLTMSFDLGSQGYKQEQGQLFYQQLLERAQSTPGVQSASLASEVPLGLGGSRRGIAIEGHERQPGEDMEFHYTVAGPSYFRAMGIPLVRGRDFSPEDRAGAPGVAIVNETMGRRFWPGQDPLGKRLSVTGSEGPYLEIVGVVKDGKYVTLGEEPLPFFSIPFLQNYESSMTLLVRGTGDPKALIPILRSEVQALDKSVPVTDVKTMTEQVSLSLLPARIAGTVLSIFGTLALLLAAVGIYGVISYAVSQRTREIGIRMALGAQRRDVLKLVVGQGMMLALIGVSAGLVTAFALTRFLASLLYGISATDILTFTVVPVLWLIVALIASYVPARRATKVDPMVALRYE